MEKEEIVFEVSVDGTGSGAKSLKTLKAEFKQLQQELDKTEIGTKAYQQALENLGNVRDEIGDLNQTINALNPEGKVQAFANVAGKLAGGFQAATGAAALFGVQSEELEKQLLKVQAATALAQGIQSVVGLTDAFKVLGAVIAANPIMFLSAAILGIVAATVALMRATDDYANSQERLNQELEQYDKLLKTTQENEEYRIRQLKVGGATEAEILKARIEGAEEQLKTAEDLAKKQLEILNNSNEDERKANYDKYIELFRQLGDYDLKVKEARKALTDFQLKSDKEEDEKRNEAAKKRREERIREEIRVHKQNTLERLAAEKIIEQEAQAEFDAIFKQLEQEDEMQSYLEFEWRKMMEGLKVEELGAKMKKEIDDKARADKEKADAIERQNRIQKEQLYLSAVTDLSATYFNTQLAAAKGNAVEEEKIRRKQFQADKALRAVQSIINTAEGVTAASPNVPLMVATGVAGAAALAKILSTQYTGTATGGTSDLNFNTPQIQTQAPNTGTIPLTRLNEQGQNLSNPVRAYVVETDVSESQERVRRLQEQSTF